MRLISLGLMTTNGDESTPFGGAEGDNLVILFCFFRCE